MRFRDFSGGDKRDRTADLMTARVASFCARQNEQKIRAKKMRIYEQIHAARIRIFSIFSPVSIWGKLTRRSSGKILVFARLFGVAARTKLGISLYQGYHTCVDKSSELVV